MILKTRKRIGLCLCLLAANLLFIWGNSLLPATVSDAISLWIKDLLGFLFPEGTTQSQGNGMLRKAAHFLEFCLLGSLFCWLFGMLRKKQWAFLLPTLGCGCLTACIDEALQCFAPGRTPGIADVIIDLSGVCLGMILFATGYLICKKRK